MSDLCYWQTHAVQQTAGSRYYGANAIRNESVPCLDVGMEGTRSRGDRYALSALRNKRASLASELVQLKRQLRHKEEMLGHVDATLRLLDPTIEINAIPSKRIVKRIKLFRQGEPGRLILKVLREANGPVSTAAIVSGVLAAGGHGDPARPTMAPPVRGNLAYQERRGKVCRTGSGTGTRWAIT